MSGFIMSTVGFLKTNANPTRLELAHGISGNLCRCQDYTKILDSMMEGAAQMRGANGADKSPATRRA
jgi:aerobic-type carbon monoxide dehydrogenase small subunit (CoxS/CutS family)